MARPEGSRRRGGKALAIAPSPPRLRAPQPFPHPQQSSIACRHFSRTACQHLPEHAPLFLGIDTGGTYTDAVLWREATGSTPGPMGGQVLAKAKALTTRQDLAVGISGAVDRVLAEAKVDPVANASMSTTLATNALVEGQGGRAALVMIGFSETDLARDGLKARSAPTPVVAGRAPRAWPRRRARPVRPRSRLAGTCQGRVGLRRLRLFRHTQPGARDSARDSSSASVPACRSPPATSCRPSSADRAAR